MKTYGDCVVTIFHNKKMPKENTPCTCLSIIMLDSIVKAKKNYYPQTSLEECKYDQKMIKIEKLINDDLGKSESDSNSNDEIESDIDNNEYEE